MENMSIYTAYRRLSTNNDYTETFHSHLGLEIMNIHEGKGSLTVNNVSYEITSGMLCLFHPYQLHYLKLDYSNNLSFERSIVIFEPAMFESYFEQWPSLYSFYRYIHSGQLDIPFLYVQQNDKELDNVFKNLQWSSQLNSAGEKLEEISLSLVMLFRIMKRIWKTNKDITDFSLFRKNHQMENILNWIENEFMNPFKLETMARDLHLSPYYLSHMFKKHIGMTISEYISARRVHQAAILLTSTNQSVFMIAEEVGVSSCSYFCKLFKKLMGTSPYQYRKRWNK